MEKILGEVNHIIFKNSLDNFYILRVLVKDSRQIDNIVVKGNFAVDIKKGQNYTFSGEYVHDPKFGFQFDAAFAQVFVPKSKDGLIKYLSSPLFPGIGEKTALKIVENLKEETLSKIKNDPDVLDYLVNEKQKKSILENLKDETYFDEAIKLFLSKGINFDTLMKIEAIYGKDMIDKIKENPYKLVEQINGFNFKTADNFAFSLDFKRDSTFRLEGAVIYAISKITMNNKDTYCFFIDIVHFLRKELEIIIEKEDLSFILEDLIYQKRIGFEKSGEEKRYFNFDQFVAESFNAKIIVDFLSKKEDKINKKEVEETLADVKGDIEFNDEQKKAIFYALSSPFSIINGGPGTGKTTIIKMIKKLAIKLYNKEVVILAPTGRAAKRIKELSGFDANTIHSFLKWDLHSNEFGVNKDNLASGDILIVDEFSMVDNLLFYNLLNGVLSFEKIILIGDQDQLPSIAPGNLLSDFLKIKEIKKVTLEKIYRQKEESKIPFFANAIKKNIAYEKYIGNGVEFIEKKPPEIKEEILKKIKNFEKDGYGLEDIQILAPMYAGEAGIDSLNLLLQQYFNPPLKEKKEYKFKKTTYREGDKILQKKNHNEKKVYNGDIGYLKNIIVDGDNVEFLIFFDEKLVSYKKNELVDITHAYCISVHKSQGSEYPVVLLPIYSRFKTMLRKKLLYTAITRTRKTLILIGEKRWFDFGVKKESKKKRKTTINNKIDIYINQTNKSV